VLPQKENRRVKPVETVVRRWGGGIKEKDEGRM
jgi:hypothetical protein